MAWFVFLKSYVSDFSGVSHSAFGDMQTLDADVPKKKDTFNLDSTDDSDFFDCYSGIP